MNILMVLSRFPFPTLKGDKLRAYYQLKELSKNHDVHLVCLAEDHEYLFYLADIEPYCKSIQVVRLGTLRKILNLTKALFSEKPFQVHYFFSAEVKQRIAEVIHSGKIDVCYVQLIRMGENMVYVPPVGYYLDYMDAFSEGMQKRVLRSSGLLKLIYKIEAKRLKKYETVLAQKFHGFSIISEADCKNFAEEIKSKIQIIPNGISNDFLDFESHDEKDIDIIFTGNMNYHPNIEAARFLCLDILPEVLKIKDKIKVYVVGTDPGTEVKSLANDYVTVTGYVPDLRPYLSKSKMMVAPLFLGSGLQNKLLEAMALSVPVLTSNHANGSLNGTHGVNVLVGESVAEFVQAIVELIDNPDKATSIGQAGKKYVSEYFDWSRWNQELELGLMKTKNQGSF